MDGGKRMDELRRRSGRAKVAAILRAIMAAREKGRGERKKKSSVPFRAAMRTISSASLVRRSRRREPCGIKREGRRGGLARLALIRVPSLPSLNYGGIHQTWPDHDAKERKKKEKEDGKGRVPHSDLGHCSKMSGLSQPTIQIGPCWMKPNSLRQESTPLQSQEREKKSSRTRAALDRLGWDQPYIFEHWTKVDLGQVCELHTVAGEKEGVKGMPVFNGWRRIGRGSAQRAKASERAANCRPVIAGTEGRPKGSRGRRMLFFTH